MERTYLAFIHKDPDSSFGVTFPDFLGCTSGGDTFEEAREMAREALALCLEGRAADGERIPPPCSPDAALAHEDAGYAIALIVVEALPERTEEEAQAELETFLASDEYQELYGQLITEEERRAWYEEPSIPETVNAGIGLKPVPDTGAGRTYAALAIQNLDGGFTVIFPDLPGCAAAGSTLEEACEMARETLALHLEGMAEDDEAIPPPSSANDAFAHPAAADAIALIVVEALPERAPEEAQAAYGSFVAPGCGQEFMRETAPNSESATAHSA